MTPPLTRASINAKDKFIIAENQRHNPKINYEMSIGKHKIAEISQNPGVYLFKNKSGGVLYVGKATNLRSRVRQYFSGHDSRETVRVMMPLVAKIETIETNSVLEALILESNLIKKYLPKYNIDGKDGKSWVYAVIIKEDFPRVVIQRKTDIDSNKSPKLKDLGKINKRNIFGPYLSRRQLEVALKIIRRIFPIHLRSGKTESGCMDFQIGLCPGPYSGAISKMDYQKNIRGIRMILEGKKHGLVKKLEKEMLVYSKECEYEKATEVRNKIFALNHIRDIALISKDENNSLVMNHQSPLRIEGYDISNISGKHSVGSMVVFENGVPNKKEYRKFKIKTVEGSDDVGSMKEVLVRRFNNDWPRPDLIVLDGGKGHLNMADELLKNMGENIFLVAVSKGSTRKNFQFLHQPADLNFQKNNEFVNDIMKNKNLLVQITSEAHRFAISYHRKVRSGALLN